MWAGLTETPQPVEPRGEDFYSPWSIRGSNWEYDKKGEQHFQSLDNIKEYQLKQYFVWGGDQIQPQPEPES